MMRDVIDVPVAARGFLPSMPEREGERIGHG